jgi:hypothetical protein
MEQRRIHEVCISLRGGIVVIPWASRDALLEQLRKVGTLDDVREAFLAVKTTQPVCLTGRRKAGLMNVITFWADTMEGGWLGGLLSPQKSSARSVDAAARIARPRQVRCFNVALDDLVGMLRHPPHTDQTSDQGEQQEAASDPGRDEQRGNPDESQEQRRKKTHTGLIPVLARPKLGLAEPVAPPTGGPCASSQRASAPKPAAASSSRLDTSTTSQPRRIGGHSVAAGVVVEENRRCGRGGSVCGGWSRASSPRACPGRGTG